MRKKGEWKNKNWEVIKRENHSPIQRKIETLSHEEGEGKEKKTQFVSYKEFKNFEKIGLNKSDFEKEMNKRVKTRLDVFKEKVEKEAYDLGFKKGEEKAFEIKSKELEKYIQLIKSFIQNLQKMQKEIFLQNKEGVFRLAYLIGKKLALREISLRQDCVLNLIRKVFESLETETKMVLYLSAKDMEFIQSMDEEDWDFVRPGILKNVSLKSSHKISPGGCLIETNYTQVNAQIEVRLEKIWTALESTFSNS